MDHPLKLFVVSLDYPPSILQVVLVFVYGQLFIIWTIIKNNRLIYSLSRGLAPSGSLFFAKVPITFSWTLPKSAYSQNFLLAQLDFCGNLSQQLNIHVGCSAVFTGIRLPPYLSKLVNMVPWQKAINIGFTHFCATPARDTASSRWATVYYRSPIWNPRIVMSISSSQRNRAKGRSKNDFA